MSEPEFSEAEEEAWGITPEEVLERISDVEGAMHADFEKFARELRTDLERVAAAVTPLLAKQHTDAQARMRVLETRLKNRQERPLIVLVANLLTDIRRLRSAEDVRDHVEQTLADALARAGYQEMGSAGDQFDPGWHEPMSGSVGRAGTVARVYSRGLACYGDVIIKAKVDVEPAFAPEDSVAEGATAGQGEPLV
jgi:molecular chaperone GrpE (heat shock protein)